MGKTVSWRSKWSQQNTKDNKAKFCWQIEGNSFATVQESGKTKTGISLPSMESLLQ